MSVGFPTDKASLDARLANATVALRNDLDGWTLAKEYFDTLADDDLTALGYTADDVQAIRENTAAFALLAQIGHGQAAQPAASDFFFNAKKLTKMN